MELKYIILIITVLAITALLFIFLTGKWLAWRIDRNTLAYQNGLLEKHTSRQEAGGMTTMTISRP